MKKPPIHHRRLRLETLTYWDRAWRRPPSIYLFKPGFQAILAPFVRALAKCHITPNQVTVFACALSIGFGTLLAWRPQSRLLLLWMPIVLLLRMALNAMDGMLARAFCANSNLGVYLNELGDVVSDVALYLPFVWLPGFESPWWIAAILLAVISEMAGVLPAMIGASRCYDGPLGKSDRAVVFGSVALWLGLGQQLPSWFFEWFPGIMCLLLAATIVNRVQSGLAVKGY